MEYSILVGGAAGQGVDTFASILERFLHIKGYYLFSNRDYMSRIRGGHNFIQIRFSNKPLWSHPVTYDLIVAFDENTIKTHQNDLNNGGYILSPLNVNGNSVTVDFQEIAKRTDNPNGFSTVALGAVIKVFGFNYEDIESILSDFFDGEILRKNIETLKGGYHAVKQLFKLFDPHKEKRMLINGNQSIGLGALTAGCKFYSAYPMTPSTGIMTYLASKQKDMEIVVEQAEDEIAAINMALGASYAGLRAMTGTSGGGFSLMVEGLGLAGIAEIPIVIAEVQRPGPATGLPTRTEQADLKFVINASQGEFPRMVIALRHLEDCFYQTVRAFNLAEKYQIPVILLSDQYLADYNASVNVFDLEKIHRENYFLDGWDKDFLYRRYAFTKTGISPMLPPGKAKWQVVKIDSDEHDTWGHIVEGSKERKAMVDKRFNKIHSLKKELIEPDYLGMTEAEILIIAWGSTYGPLKEAIEFLNHGGLSVGALVFGDIWPLPSNKLMEVAEKAKMIINIEGNYTGQLAGIIREETGITCQHSILKYDGRPFSAVEIVKRLKEVL